MARKHIRSPNLGCPLNKQELDVFTPSDLEMMRYAVDGMPWGLQVDLWWAAFDELYDRWNRRSGEDRRKNGLSMPKVR